MGTVGDRVKRFRLDRGMTQEELGEILGITKAAVQKYENGTIRKLCEIFDAPPAYFVFDRVPDLTDGNAKEVLVAHFGKWLISFLESLDDLNGKGKVKLVKYCNDLRKIEEYRKKKRRRLVS